MGWTNQFQSSKRFPDILPAPGHGVLLQTGAFSKGGGLFSGVSGTLETVAGSGMAVSLGLRAVLGLNLFVGAALLLFSTVLFFLNLGFVSS